MNSKGGWVLQVTLWARQSRGPSAGEGAAAISPSNHPALLCRAGPAWQQSMDGIAQRAPGHGQAGGTDRLSGSLFQHPATLSVHKRILVPSW